MTVEANEKAIAAIEKNLLTVTDRLDMLDPLIQSKQHMYFRCLHSGKFFPADYIKEWGRKYGIGLGGDPRSEALDSDYYTRPSLEGIKTIEDIMHPCKISGAPLDVAFLSKVPPADQLLITSQGDRDGSRRGRLMRANQLRNPLNKIAALVSVAVRENLVYVPQGGEA